MSRRGGVLHATSNLLKFPKLKGQTAKGLAHHYPELFERSGISGLKTKPRLREPVVDVQPVAEAPRALHIRAREPPPPAPPPQAPPPQAPPRAPAPKRMARASAPAPEYSARGQPRTPHEERKLQAEISRIRDPSQREEYRNLAQRHPNVKRMSALQSYYSRQWRHVRM